MRAREALEKHREEIRRIVLAHKAENPRVFGSVATGTDDDESDLDLLIDPVRGMSLLDLGGMYNDLEKFMPVKVDIAMADGLRVHYRQKVLDEAIPL